jgi:hypothetical protein
MTRKGRLVLSGLALTILFLLPLLPEVTGSRRLVFRDAQITHWPWRRVATATLAAGEVPFVNASASGGQPLLANPNAVLLYPTFLLEKVLPASAAFNLHYLLHVLWSFAGARRLATRLGVSEGGAFFAGVTFAFSGAMLSYGSAFMNSAAAAAWLPWCAAAGLDLAHAETRRRAWRASAAAGAALGMQLLAGEPAISVLTAMLLVYLTVAEAWRAGGGRGRRLVALVAGGAGAAALAALIAAPLLLPLRAIFSLTYRGQHLYSERAFGASPFFPWRAVEWLFPRFSGDPGTLGGGAAWISSIHEGELVYLWSVTLGVLPVMVFALAALRGEFWSRRSKVLAAGAVATLLFSVGFALPFYRLLYEVDALRRLRYPIKFYLLTTLCFAMLAGMAADSLRRRRAGAREAAALAALLAIFGAGWILAREGDLLERWAAPLLAEMSTSPRDFLSAFRAAVQGDALLGSAAALLLALLLFTRRKAPLAGYALGFVTLLLAFRWGLPLFVSASDRELARPPALLAALDGDGRLYVSPKLPRFDPDALPDPRGPGELPRVSRVARVLIEELIPQTAAEWGVRHVFDHDPDGSYGYYNRLAGEAVTASTPFERDRLLAVYGGRWALWEEEEQHPLFRGVTGFAVAGRRLVLGQIGAPLPEIRWAQRAHRRRSLSGALDLLRAGPFDLRRDVVIPGRTDATETGEGRPGSVMVEVARPDRAFLRAASPAGGHVIFSRTYFSAWKASVDGSPAPVLVANARDLAVAVPAGSHRVAFWYDRSPFHRGVILQCAALLLLGAVALRTALRRRALPARARSAV